MTILKAHQKQTRKSERKSTTFRQSIMDANIYTSLRLLVLFAHLKMFYCLSSFINIKNKTRSHIN